MSLLDGLLQRGFLPGDQMADLGTIVSHMTYLVRIGSPALYVYLIADEDNRLIKTQLEVYAKVKPPKTRNPPPFLFGMPYRDPEELMVAVDYIYSLVKDSKGRDSLDSVPQFEPVLAGDDRAGRAWEWRLKP